MSILRLVVSFILCLLKSQRQLVLENLALRQQVTMLRQSVKRPRATSADRMFCSKRDVNKRKESTKHPVVLDYPSPNHLPQPLPPHHPRRVRRVYLWLLPRVGPHTFFHIHNISAR
jgi:hypothetical protein